MVDRKEQIVDCISSGQYHALLDISHTVNSSLDIQEILDLVLSELATVVEASASSIWLLDDDKQRLNVATATGEKSEEIKEIVLEIGEGIVGSVVKEGTSLITQDAQKEKEHAISIAEKLDFAATTMMCVPIMTRDRIIGAIQLLNKADSQPFSEENLYLTEVVANAAGIALENAHLHNFLQRENQTLRYELGTNHTQFQDIIGSSPKMRKVLELSERVAQTSSTVLLRGESGTGKEIIAQSIHNASSRAKKPFIPVNCAALPDNLLESELFGHERGAFTGATSRKEGRFELANQGTLFLDEIGDMQIGLQAKLLRVLQDQQIYRVGGTAPINCDARIISATNQDIESKIKQGSFREDLYYRLNVITIGLPTLHERIEDILRLASHFLNKYSWEMKRMKTGFSPDAVQILMTHTWPGNVRELQNAIEHAVVLGKDEEIQVEDLPLSLRKNWSKSEIPNKTLALEDAQRGFKKQYIQYMLAQNDGNRSKTAEVLDIQRTYLSRLIRELNIGE